MPGSPPGESPGAAVQPDDGHPDGGTGVLRVHLLRAAREQWLRRLQLQRRLHDGASLRISALVPQLGVVRNRVPAVAPDLDASLQGLQDQLHTVLQELREVSREIYPPLLDQAGLGPALREFADRVAVPLCVTAPDERFGPEVEGTVYFAVTDSLALLEAGGGRAEVVLRREGDVLVVCLDGVPPAHAAGILGHVRGLGGRVTVEGTAGPATITMRIPCG
jgi:signal transduction histidine kinase